MSSDKALVLWDAIVENHSDRSSYTNGHQAPSFVVVFRLGLIENWVRDDIGRGVEALLLECNDQ